ncbi:MAG: NUDIX domain-containing protein [Bacteroidia bacterium]|nr:NUDIX domain-containing protein [Bacteroidia bacterium]
MYRIFHGKHRILLSSNENAGFNFDPDFVFKKPNEEQVKEALRVSKKSTKPLKIQIVGNPDKLLKKVFLEFKLVEAAGGIVENEKGEILLMKRLGKWDLPKGKAKKNENMEECAIREIEEETGAKQLSITRHFMETYHTYFRNNEWQIKHTHWFLIKCLDGNHLVPQTAEDIEEVRWVKPKKIHLPILHTYPAIRRILKEYKKMLKKATD